MLASGNSRPAQARWIALASALLVLALCVPLYNGLDAGNASMQFVERHAWFPAINTWYSLGVDGISVALIALTAFVTVLTLVGAWEVIEDRVHQYFASFLFLEALMIGVFCAARRAAVLRVLRGHADPDVHHHRRVGRPAAGLRHDQVLPLHLPRLDLHAGRA